MNISLYSQVYRIGLQNTLVYRWNYVLRTLIGFVPLIGMMALWSAVMEGDKTIAGHTFKSMIAYYLGVLLLDLLTSPMEDDFQVASDIKDGQLSQILLKPMDYLVYRLSLYLAGRSIYTLSALIPGLLAVAALWDHVSWVPLSQTWLPGVFATVGSGLLQFQIALLTGLAAFWLLEVGSVVFILYAFEHLAGGHVFPLDLLPDGIRQICFLLPFPYETYFPVSVWMGRVHGTELWMGLAMQYGWILVLGLLGRWIWGLGLRHYTAVGG